MNPILILIPVLLGTILLGVFAWQRTRRQRAMDEAANHAAALLDAARATPLPEGSAEVRASLRAGRRRVSDGRIMLLLVGTFGENLGQNLLRLLAQCDLAQAIGSVLVLELDTRRREHFLAGVPDIFGPRIEVVSFSGLSGGGGNDPDVVRSQIAGWGPAVVHGAQRVVERHLATQRGEEPALILVVLGQGGQTPTGLIALDQLRQLLPRAKSYGLTALPVDDLLRQRVSGTLADYRAAGVEGFIVADNLQDELRNDFGMIAAMTAFVDASEHSDAAVEANNGLYLLFKEAPGKLVSYSTALRMIPGYCFQPHPSLPPRYYIYKQTLDAAILTGLDQVDRADHHALGQASNGSVPLTSRFDLVLAAVVPEALQAHADYIQLGQQMKGIDKRNYHFLAGSIATEIDPDAPRCPVAVVALRALPDGDATLASLTVPSGTVQLTATTTATSATNGTTNRQQKRKIRHAAS